MRPQLRALATLAFSLTLLLLLPANTSADITDVFWTPSHNIRCAVDRSPDDDWYLTCGVMSAGRQFGMREQGRVRREALGPWDPKLHRFATLGYGRTKRYGPFTCTSAQTGLTCKNRAGHGWALARARQRVF